ncbi:lysophospholipase L1-like esterase [Paenibacillus sp. PastF-3]|uniref:SGNH/GDSL hydrolase family protein n=1 Tax=Paenibacillus sp. PastF-3 TaxID=2940626 RepID=UPI002476E08B|nr:SGNH/GDSL hydrolase family protein [Paenibacillus sp. PastF-3]MDH6373527.1 lysophospholipase L1-like esterase [Paenibacillus sp. PastF-3]
MAQQPMYPAVANSIITELAADVTNSSITITVVNGASLPAGPNLITIGWDETAETVLYTAKSGNTLTGCTRGFGGTIARPWGTSSRVARYFTAADHESFRKNILDVAGEVETARTGAGPDYIGYDSLPERLEAEKAEIDSRIDAANAQLADIAKFQFVEDIVNTTYKAGKKIDLNYVQSQQAILLAKFYQKLRNGLETKIICKGDSLTYGYDLISSDIRPGINGSTTTIASATYPEKLQEYLNQIYNNKVTVLNRGYSGDWVKQGFYRWQTYQASDLTICMYGTNDYNASWVPDDIRGNIEQYLYWYEQFIVREILWGKAVIILTSPKMQSAAANALDVFRNSLYLLGEKYGVPVIDAEKFSKNYPISIYSDTVHFNGAGYSVFAARLASVFIGEGLKNINFVGNGSKLLSRPTMDNIVYFNGSSFTVNSPTNTPNETDASKGIVASIPNGAGIIYSFYAEKDDLVVLPYAYLTGGSMILELDFGVIQPQNSIDGALFSPYGSELEPSSITYLKLANDYSKRMILKNNLATLRIVSDGWHTLKIKSAGGTTIFNGVEFISKESFIDLPKKSSYLGRTSDTYTSDVITETRINLDDLVISLGLRDVFIETSQYWKHPAIEITVSNYTQSVIKYQYIQGSMSDNSGSAFLGEISRKNIAATPVERTISNVTYNTQTNEFVITWSGATNKPAVFSVRLA